MVERTAKSQLQVECLPREFCIRDNRSDVSSNDQSGHGYSAGRQPDPRITARICQAIGDARTVLNVGAGTGNYEPADRPVIAVEPSVVMAAQRPLNRPPAVLASAEALPFAVSSVDAVMAVLTIHHWDDVRAGLREAVRVARRRIVLLTVDPLVEAQMWLLRDYIPEVAARDAQEFPSIRQLMDAGLRLVIAEC